MDFSKARAIVREHALDMLKAPGTGIELIAVGVKHGGSLAGASDFCVTAYVREKLTDEQMKSRSVASFASAFTGAVGWPPPPEFDIDVVECGSAFTPRVGLSVPAAQRGLYGGQPPVLDAQKWFRSLRCGIGITNPMGEYPQRLSVGTAGFYVRDGDDGLYLVSNNHVIGRSNVAVVGEAVVQPGTLDLTGNELQSMPNLAALVQQLRIAEIAAVVTLQFATPHNTPHNRVDVAAARVLETGRSVLDVGRLTFGGSLRGVAAPYEVDATGVIQGSARVYKVGRTTGYTEGEVVGLGGTSSITYPGGVAHFVDQIVVRATADNVGPFSAQGDSGSGVLNERHELVGLLFAGSQYQTLVNPAGEVLRELAGALGRGPLTPVSS